MHKSILEVSHMWTFPSGPKKIANSQGNYRNCLDSIANDSDHWCGFLIFYWAPYGFQGCFWGILGYFWGWNELETAVFGDFDRFSNLWGFGDNTSWAMFQGWGRVKKLCGRKFSTKVLIFEIFCIENWYRRWNVKKRHEMEQNSGFFGNPTRFSNP